MNKVFKIIGIIVLFAIVVFGLAFFLTSGVVDSADKFFNLVKENKTREAYDSTAKGFQSATGYNDFTSFLEKNSLNKFVSSYWSDRSVNNNQGRVQGTIITSGKGAAPYSIDFLNEDGQWKVLNIKPVLGGVQSDSQTEQTLTLPSDQEIMKLVNGTMVLFVDALKIADFKDFYNAVARVWKVKTSSDDLKKSFGSFLKEYPSISFISSTDPTFTNKPVIDKDGFLVVKGYYPSKNVTLSFILKYTYEYPDWKLIDIDVQAK